VGRGETGTLLDIPIRHASLVPVVAIGSDASTSEGSVQPIHSVTILQTWKGDSLVRDRDAVDTHYQQGKGPKDSSKSDHNVVVDLVVE
jgi:hypothetical protein